MSYYTRAYFCFTFVRTDAFSGSIHHFIHHSNLRINSFKRVFLFFIVFVSFFFFFFIEINLPCLLPRQYRISTDFLRKARKCTRGQIEHIIVLRG